MTVEELEIIVRAKVEEARSSIKKLVKDVKKDLNGINDADVNINTKVTKEVNNAKKTVQTASKQISTYVYNMFDNIDTKKLDEVRAKFKDVLDETREGHLGVKVENMDEVYEFLDKIKAFDNEEIEPQIKIPKIQDNSSSSTTPKADAKSSASSSIDVNASIEKITTLKQAFGNVIGEVQRNFPTITSTINNAFNQINANPIVTKITSAVNTAKQQLSNVKVDVSNWFNSSPLLNKVKQVTNSAKSTFQQGMSKAGNIGNALAIPFDMLKQKVSDVKSKVSGVFDKFKTGAGKAVGAVKKVASALGLVKKRSSDVSKGAGLGNIGSAFEKGISSVKRFAMGLLSVQTAYSLVSKAAQAYLSYDTQLSDSIQNSWNVLGSLLAPILEYVASLFAKVVSYVAAFVKALTGVDLVARANAKGLQKQASATKSATKAQQENKQLSGIDDLNNLTSSSSSSGDSGSGSDFTPITTAEIDTGFIDGFASKVESVMGTIKEHLLTLFEPIQASWNTYGAGLIDSMSFAFSGITQLAGAIYTSFEQVWTNGTGEEFCNNILIGFTNIYNIVGGISSSIADVWTQTGLGTDIIQLIFDIINDNMEIVNTIGGYFAEWTVSDTFKNTISSILSVIKSILEFTESITGSLLEWVASEDFKKALDAIFEVIDDILVWVKDIADWVVELWDKYCSPVFDNLLTVFTDLINTIKVIWDVAKPIIDKIIEQVKKYLEPVIKSVVATINNIINIVKGVLEFITGVFTGDWKKAFNGLKKIVSNVLDGIKNIFSTIFNTIWGIVKGIINGIIAGFETMVNTVIKGLNALLKPLRSIGNSVLKAVGIKGFSFNEISKVSLPRLATGNVATEETLAIFGEYANAKNNPEVTSPVSIMRDTFREVLSEFEVGGTKYDRLVINYLGKNILDENVDYINEQSKIKGVQIIKDGG